MKEEPVPVGDVGTPSNAGPNRVVHGNDLFVNRRTGIIQDRFTVKPTLFGLPHTVNASPPGTDVSVADFLNAVVVGHTADRVVHRMPLVRIGYVIMTLRADLTPDKLILGRPTRRRLDCHLRGLCRSRRRKGTQRIRSVFSADSVIGRGCDDHPDAQKNDDAQPTTLLIRSQCNRLPIRKTKRLIDRHGNGRAWIRIERRFS